jgi:hypothetical protein
MNDGCLALLAPWLKPKPPTPPPPPPAVVPVTRDTDFRSLPPISLARLGEILEPYPLRDDLGNIHAATLGNPLPVAQSWPESRYGQDPNATLTHNPLGLFWDSRWAPGPHIDNPPLLIFGSWGAAFAEWTRRMASPGYKNGVYPQGMTLAQFVWTYVAGPGPGYANGESAESVERYLTQTIARINRYYGINDPVPETRGDSRKRYEVAGLAHPIPLSFPLRQKIVPRSMTRNRPGIFQTPERWVQHETDNESPTANAANQADYLYRGAEGRQASWHFTIDDIEAWQTIPVNEVTWNGGDNDGPCNFGGVSCELCVNMVGDPARMRKARANAEELAAEILRAVDRRTIDFHTDCCRRAGNPAGCHAGCPKHMIADGYLGVFRINVGRRLAS